MRGRRSVAILSFVLLGGIAGPAQGQHWHQRLYQQALQQQHLLQARQHWHQLQQHNLHLQQVQQQHTMQQQQALVRQYRELQRPLLQQWHRERAALKGSGGNATSSRPAYTQSATVTMANVNARGKLAAKTIDVSTNFPYTWHKQAAAKAAVLAAQGGSPKWVQVSRAKTVRNAFGAPVSSAVTVDVTSNFAPPKHYFFHVQLNDGFLQNGINQELNRLDSLYGLGPYRPAVVQALQNLR